MFESVVSELAGQFGLGDKAPALVKTILGYITDPATGGLSGLMAKFNDAGVGSVAQSWLGATTPPAPLAPTDVDRALGGSGGLIDTITSKLGIPAATASAAVAAALPMLISKLTPGGVLPTALPSGVAGFLGETGTAFRGAATGAAGAVSGMAGAATGAARTATYSATAAATDTAAAATGGLMRWLPWILGAIVLIALYFYFTRKHEPVATTTTADTTTVAPAEPAAEPIPTGAGAIATTVAGLPTLTVYFDTGKAEIAPEFADKATGVVDYLKTAPSAKLIVSGFNDPTGNAALNAELSKKRAKAVAAALKTAGADESKVVLEKPAETTGTGDTNAESRRVEVVVRQ